MMKLKSLFLGVFLCFLHCAFAQQDQSGILKTILSTYYKTEKPVVKGRAQFLYLFCQKANNNEELFETINQLKLSKEETLLLKNRVNVDKGDKNWADEIDAVFKTGNEVLKTKVNACLSLEEFQAKQEKTNFKNQRLLIISKPVFYADGKTALVKVVFYRSIEHNSGSVLLMRKNGDSWEITTQLNPWET